MRLQSVMENEKYITVDPKDKFKKEAARSVGPGGFWDNEQNTSTNKGRATFISKQTPNYM